MPVANDFLTWPRSFKEQRKKIPQDAAVQRVTNSSSQTKYEAEDTLENDYNLLKQQVYIPAVWRRNSKGDHPTRKSTSHLLPETGSGFWGQNGASSTSCPLCLLADSPYSFVLKRGVTLVVSNSGKRNWAYVASSLWPSIFITGSSINHQNTACVSSFWSARPPRWYILVCERSMVWGDAKSTISHLDASCYILPSSYYW